MLDFLGIPSVWDFITVLVDNIPKFIYFLYAAIASTLDLLQCVMRKLAGLDSYWVNGVEYAQQDPVLEFIYGTLGIGPNASAYGTLNVVFWSLTIFGGIVLVVSTMIAIIKSHYGEDVGKTNPMTHVYTAVKSVFTFAITPVAVLIGIYLSQFLLQTLDAITAQPATEEAVKGIYGSKADNLVGQDINGYRYYARYDYFNITFRDHFTTSTTFSGMMFRAAAYEANRMRIDGKFYGGTQNDCYLIGDTTGAAANGMSNNDWIAYQIDYAFVNNLKIKQVVYPTALYGVWSVVQNTLGCDFFAVLGPTNGFSKYAVGFVWYFYNLWKFNFFIGFVSIVMGFGILTSVIIGLMSRLIKGAALFLIYPATLGLAPLDNWKAFQSWRTEFMSQILMAFGAIIGINIVFLILPLVNEISWFDVGLLDYIMNTIVIIVGMLTVKDLIQFMSSLIGAADALKEGDKFKKDGLDVAKKAGKAGMMVGSVGFRAARFLPTVIKRYRAGKDAEKLQGEITRQEGLLDADPDIDGSGKTAQQRQTEAANNAKTRRNELKRDWAAKHGADFKARATALGLVKGSTEYEAMKEQEINDFMGKDSQLQGYMDIVNKGGHSKGYLERRETVENLKTERQHAVASGLLDDKTNESKGAFRTTFRELGASIIKAAQEGLKEASGINMQSVGEVFKAGTLKHYDKDGNVTGSYVDDARTAGATFAGLGRLARDTAKGAFGDDTGHVSAGSILAGTFRSIGHGLLSNYNGFNSRPEMSPPKDPKAEDKLARSSDSLDSAVTSLNTVSQALLKAVEKLNRHRP